MHYLLKKKAMLLYRNIVLKFTTLKKTKNGSIIFCWIIWPYIEFVKKLIATSLTDSIFSIFSSTTNISQNHLGGQKFCGEGPFLTCGPDVASPRIRGVCRSWRHRSQMAVNAEIWKLFVLTLWKIEGYVKNKNDVCAYYFLQ